MRKKIVVIMAAILVVLVIVAVALGMTGKQEGKEAEDDLAGVEVASGLEESIFDDEFEEGEDLETSGDQQNDSNGVSETSDNKQGDTKKQNNSSSQKNGNSSSSTSSKPTGGSNSGNSSSGNSNSGNSNSGNSSSGNSNSGNSSSGNNNSGNNNSGNSNSGNKKMDYESFHAMSPSDQQKYMESYDDIDDFFDWYNAAKEKYEKENPSIEVGGGSIDLDKIVNGN